MNSTRIDEKAHQELFSGYSLKLGQGHWYILRADNEMERRCYTGTGQRRTRTDFGKQVGSDELHWWVFRKEDQVDELQRRTEEVLQSVQRLKVASGKLRTNPPNKYDELISTLNQFCASHSSEIDDLYDYVTWLHERNALAPSILFTYRVWGDTRRSDRWVRIEADTLQAEASEIMERVIEHIFGLRNQWGYTLVSVYDQVSRETYEDLDPEYHGPPVRISMNRVYTQTSYEALGGFAIFLEFIRDSLRNVLLDIEKRHQQRELMRSEAFWSQFIEKAKGEKRTENQLWDFKKTLTMWHVKKADVKAKHELEFCETLVSLANAKGGVLIVGVSDTPPREVLGIGDDLSQIEARLKYTRTVIANYIKYDRDIVYFKQVPLQDRSDEDKICLVIVIAQAEGVVSVRDKQGRFSFPVRRATGLDRIDRGELAIKKIHIKSDNYDFMEELEQFVRDP
jgi:hypothetical protein